MSKFQSFTSIAFYCALGAAIYFLFWIPERDQQRLLGQKINHQKIEISDLRQRIIGLRETVPTAALPDNLIWKSSTRSDAELALQDAVLDIANQYNISILTFGTAIGNLGIDETKISIEFEIEGPLDDFYNFLSDVENTSPRIAIANMQVRPTQNLSDVAEQTYIYARLLFWGYWQISQ